MARKSPVRSQMNSSVPSTHGNPGLYGSNKSPFDAPQSMGNGSIPTIFFQSMGEKVATTVSAGLADASGGNAREPGRGSRRFKA